MIITEFPLRGFKISGVTTAGTNGLIGYYSSTVVINDNRGYRLRPWLFYVKYGTLYRLVDIGEGELLAAYNDIFPVNGFDREYIRIRYRVQAIRIATHPGAMPVVGAGHTNRINFWGLAAGCQEKRSQ